MNIIDAIIILFLITSLFRGHELGFVRQLLSTIGFFVGIAIGALIEPLTVSWVDTAAAKSIVALITTLGMGFLMLSVGEYLGILLKNKISFKRINTADNALGSGIAFISVLVAVWLSAAIAQATPLPDLQENLEESRILTFLDERFPPAPPVIASLGRLIDPNGFPEVFSGEEPTPPTGIPTPDLGELQPAVQATKASVVKIEGQGCGGIVEGSGFVVAKDLVVTNAHVIAGIRKPYVSDSNGTRVATAIWFDPDLDLAVLRTSKLSGKPLQIDTTEATRGTVAAVLGYPGGGSFRAEPAAVLDTFTASGRNIYGEDTVRREIYELQAEIIPGNSGGPVVDKTGHVIGVVFAESTTYKHVGYALTGSAVADEVAQARARNQVVGTGSCAE